MRPRALLFTLLALSITLRAAYSEPVDTTAKDQFRSAKWAYQTKDYRTAYELLLPQAEQGMAEAQVLLGKMYRDGQGVPRSFRDASFWLQRAWEQGYKPAAAEMGYIFDQGLLVARDVKEAIRWYELAGKSSSYSGRYKDLRFHRESNPFYLLPEPGREAFAPPTDDALAEQERFTAEVYKKLAVNLPLPEVATKDCYYTHDVVVDDNNVIKDIKSAGVSVGDHCRVPYTELSQFQEEVKAALWKSSPLPPRPSWVTSARPIRIKVPRARYELPANKKATVPDQLLGNFASRIAVATATANFAMSLSCNQFSGCALANTSTQNGTPSTTVTTIRDIYPLKDFGQVRLSFQYAKTHQDDAIVNPEHAAIMAALRPYLSPDQEIGECFDLGIGGRDASVACTLKSPPIKNPALLFLGATLGACANGFCGYVIYPLQRVESGRMEVTPPRPADTVSEPRAPQNSVCGFTGLNLPEGYALYAAGAYAGRKTSFQIDQSGHEGTQIDVVANSASKPVVLMLGAYEPTIWNISRTARTQILAVLVGGYHRQAVAGLEKEIPLLISTYDNRGTCGYFYITPDNLAPLNPLARRVFGRAVDMVFPAEKGSVVIGEPLAPGMKLVTATETQPESFYDKSAPIAGVAGLEDAVRRGVLRKATASDADAWIDAVAQSAPPQDLPPVAGQAVPKLPKPMLYNAYVVLQPFTYPSGLYGANLATFFIPKGVPKPAGNPGHSSVYDFNTMTCRGASCRAR